MRLRMNGASATLAANVLTQTAYEINTAGAIAVTAINGDAITLQGAATTVSLANAVGSTELSLTLANQGTAVGGTTLNTNGFNVVNLVSNGINNVANTFTGAIANNANMALNITGNTGFTANGGFSNQIVINGADAGGAISVTGSTAADSITGGAFADTLLGGAGNDTIKGGAGNDQITGGAGADTIDGGVGIDTYTIAADVVATLTSESALTGVTGALTAANLATFTRAWDIYTVTSGDVFFIDSGTVDLTGGVIDNGTTAALIGGTIAAGGAITWNDGTNTYLVIDTDNTVATTIDANDTFIVINGIVSITGAAATGTDANYTVV